MGSAELAVGAAGPRNQNRRSGWLKQGLGYLFALTCLVWVFHDFNFSRLPAQLGNLQWKWIALAVSVDILSYLCQGLRWKLLLRPLGSISVLETTQAIYVGLFANELLPMRVGEMIRGYLASRRLRTRFFAVIPSQIVERFFDGVCLAVGIGLTALFIPLPKDLLAAGEVLGLVLLLGTGATVYAVLRRRNRAATEPEPGVSGGNWLATVKSFLNHVAAALHTLGKSRGFYPSFGLSVILLFVQALAYWLVMLAYGLPLPFREGLAVLLILRLGTAIPNAPANIGSYQFFSVLGVTLFGIDKSVATGFSVVVFVVLTVPLWLIGGFALSQTGTTLAAIRGEIRKRMDRSDRTKRASITLP